MQKQIVIYKWFVKDPSEDSSYRYLVIDHNTSPSRVITAFNDADLERRALEWTGRKGIEIIEREKAGDKYKFRTIDIVALKC